MTATAAQPRTGLRLVIILSSLSLQIDSGTHCGMSAPQLREAGADISALCVIV
jgi:hypothetical protein